MKTEMLEIGKIINTHGVRGELKVESWLNDPADFGGLDTVFVNGNAFAVRSARVQGNHALLTLEGISSIDDALPLKNKILSASRADLPIDEGEHFVADLIGMDAVNAETGAVFGKVTDVLEYPAQDVYQVAGLDGKEYLIPDVPAFVHEIDDARGAIVMTVLEGLGQ
ncbi:MAG: ribosome maturation factor RimM [Clostridiales bacterium]|nr:ribosome maturation factor RimM [Clostridiales bacterium]